MRTSRRAHHVAEWVALCCVVACSVPQPSRPSITPKKAEEKVANASGAAAPMPRRLAVGERRICLIDLDAVHCWKRRGPSLVAEREPGAFAAVAVTATGLCLLDPEGRVHCRSDGGEGKLRPLQLEGIVELASSETQVCARSDQGAVSCFEPLPERPEIVQVLAAGSSELRAVLRHVCSIDARQRPTCWLRPNIPAAPPTVLSQTRSHSAPSQLALGIDHRCNLQNGTVRCSGDDAWGAATSPTGLDGRVLEIGAAAHTSCALTANSSVHCWGMLNLDFEARSTKSVTVPLPAPASQLVAGDHQHCARLAGGRWYCWGQRWSWGSASAVGGWPPRRRPELHRFAAEPVNELDRAAELSMGGGFACWVEQGSAACLLPRAAEAAGAVREDLELLPLGAALKTTAGGELVCLEKRQRRTRCFRPGEPGTSVLEFTGISADELRLGPGHVCVLKGPELSCRALPGAGEEDRVTSEQVIGGTGSLVTPPSGMGTVWRAESGGTVATEWSLRDAAAFGSVTHPGPIARMVGFSGAHCALLADATVTCGGHEAPEATRVLDDVAELVAGQRSFCARQKDGSVGCWGSNENGQLGLGQTPYTDTPQQVYPER